MTNMPSVLIVEDQKMARDIMAGYVEDSGRYRLAGAIANAATAELFCESRPVDLILMDVCTERDESGLDAAAVIKKRFPRIKIIIVTSMAEVGFIDRAREVKADSFWYKDVSQEDLLAVMDRTVNGESVYPDKTPEVKLGMATSYDLTKQELAVLRAVMESASYQEAAEKLGCTDRNIRFHMDNMMDKTGYRSRMVLMTAVAQKKLIITNPDKDIE
jgi:two-component system vancomycin resistance associated response regulator VraR